jgi:hypothetical protein
LALDQFLVHLQIPLAFSKVLQIVWHSLIETCLLRCAIVWLKNWESMLLLQIAARLVYIFVGDAIWRSQAQISSTTGSWPSDLPTFNEALIVEVFISKLAWYNQKSNG